MWNERTELNSPHDLANPDESGSVRIIVNCVFCGAENVIWVKKSGVKRSKLIRGDQP